MDGVALCADIEVAEPVAAPSVPLRPALVDLRGTGASPGHRRQILEDLTGRRARLMAYLARGVGALFALWFVLLALGGLGLIPVAGIPLARLVHPEPQPLPERPSATRVHRLPASQNGLAVGTVPATETSRGAHERGPLPRQERRKTSIVHRAKSMNAGARDRAHRPTAAVPVAPIPPGAAEASPGLAHDAIETPRISEGSPAPAISEEPAATPDAQKPAGSPGHGTSGGGTSSGSSTPATGGSGSSSSPPPPPPSPPGGSGSSSTTAASSGGTPGSGQSTGASGTAPGSGISTGTSGTAPGSGKSTGASGTAPGSGKSTGGSGVAPGSGHATGDGNGNSNGRGRGAAGA